MHSDESRCGHYIQARKQHAYGISTLIAREAQSRVGQLNIQIFGHGKPISFTYFPDYGHLGPVCDVMHVRQADEAVHIGPSPAAESYLAGEKIIASAKQSGAEAIHPGYGFLSENADFAQSVIDAGLIWVGPKPDSIRAMGLKDAAKKLMDEAGVPKGGCGRRRKRHAQSHFRRQLCR